MSEVIGVRFKEVGKIYYFDPSGERFLENDRVIVETARGVECGIVAMPNRNIADEKIIRPLKSVMRRERGGYEDNRAEQGKGKARL